VAVKQTPLIAQYLSVKQRVPDAILFFRLGDFYEMFFEDAEVGARVLDIQLTSRNKDGVPLCGVPYHSAEPYIAKLLKAGHKVAICEQGTPDARSPKLMPRQIVRVITPGTVSEEMVLTAAEKSYLVAVTGAEGTGFALAALDVSTGEFLATQVREAGSLREEIARIAPREIIVAGQVPGQDDELGALLNDLNCPVTTLDHESFSAERATAAFSNRFAAAAADLHESIARAAGIALLYVENTFGHDLAHLEAPRLYRIAEYMLVDETTRRHLELVASTDGARKGSLLSILDETLTAAGARTLGNWITYPLLSLDAIRARHDAAEELFDADLGGALAESLKQIGDLERLAGRIGAMRASPRDCLRLGDALGAVESLKRAMGALKSPLIREQAARISPMPALVAQIEATLSDEPPVNPRDGNVIRPGLSAEVDELRSLASGARGVIAKLEATERARTAIPSLKVRYNNIFGYYIEVTKPNLERVPADYERKQTLVSAERFTTPALKELERKILTAESGLKELELQIFSRLLRDLQSHAATILETARAVGEFDAIMSLAKVARRRGYVRPTINTGLRIRVRDGRHPVLEAGMRSGEFVPNDLDAEPDTRQILLITGPNMAGKSTFLRQNALIALLAQTGSFVPAARARIGIIDRLFSRVGAADDLARGRSTFMVEMVETAVILNQASERSLVILDEIGRGTATFDGLSIAWAAIEHLHEANRCRALFATHYHELTALSAKLPRLFNATVRVKEWQGDVVFLHEVLPGSADRSYGIQVAKLAGLPPAVIARAKSVLAKLEAQDRGQTARALADDLPLFAVPSRASAEPAPPSEAEKLIEALKALHPDEMSPREALEALYALKAKLPKA